MHFEIGTFEIIFVYSEQVALDIQWQIVHNKKINTEFRFFWNVLRTSNKMLACNSL